MHKVAVTASPHIHDGSNTRRIMLDVIIALTPALIAATIFFGPQVLALAATTVLSAVFFEMVTRRIMKKDVTSVFDLSAVVTGLILALSLPANTPLPLAILGSAVAIVVIKQIFGGLLGRNPINPALGGRLVAMRIVAVIMALSGGNGYLTPLAWLQSTYYNGVDVITSATPLQLLTDGAALPGFGELFLGIHSGAMGETATIALFLGGAYLVWRRVISPLVPLTFIGTTLLALALMGQNPLFHLLTGGLVFAAIFMATDYSTSPITLKGKIIFAIGCGLIVAFVRSPGSGPTDGITHALIAMNLLVPLIDKFTLSKAFGYKKG